MKVKNIWSYTIASWFDSSLLMVDHLLYQQDMKYLLSLIPNYRYYLYHHCPRRKNNKISMISHAKPFLIPAIFLNATGCQHNIIIMLYTNLKTRSTILLCKVKYTSIIDVFYAACCLIFLHEAPLLLPHTCVLLKHNDSSFSYPPERNTNCNPLLLLS